MKMKKAFLVFMMVSISLASISAQAANLSIRNGFRGVVEINPVPVNEFGTTREAYHGFEAVGPEISFNYQGVQEVSLTATPDFGYEFAYWVVVDPDKAGTYHYSNPLVKEVSADHTVHAVFLRDYIYAVNCGSTDHYSGIDGVSYVPDNYFVNGNTGVNIVPSGTDIKGTDEDGLYRTSRTGDFSYSFPNSKIPTGDYYIIFKFNEGQDSAREFNVSIEGESYITKLNLNNVVRKNRAYEAIFPFKYNKSADDNSTLDINFTGTVGDATVSGIVIQDDSGIEAKIDAIMADVEALADPLGFKIGQMTMPHIDQLFEDPMSGGPADYSLVNSKSLGVIFNGGGDPSSIQENTPLEWATMIDSVQTNAPEVGGVKIPVLYATDVLHGFAHLKTGTVFPHNIGLGSGDNISLVEKIGEITAFEATTCGIKMTFAPCLTVAQDLRWGRVNEGYGERTDIVERLGAALIRGVQGGDVGLSGKNALAATAKHYLGDGGTRVGTGWNLEDGMIFTEPPKFPTNDDNKWENNPLNPPFVNPGVNYGSDQELKDVHLPPYRRAIEQGLTSVMASYSAIGNHSNFCHTNDKILKTWLKDELKFSGFITSDMDGVAKTAVRESSSWKTYDSGNVPEVINSGIDIAMCSNEWWADDPGAPSLFWQYYQSTLRTAVTSGAVPMEELDESVRRLLRVKLKLNLFANPYVLKTHWRSREAKIGSLESKEVARQAVRESLVMLKNGDLNATEKVLPLTPQKYSKVGLVGQFADDIGVMAGGWSLEWLGSEGDIYPEGTTIKEAMDQRGVSYVYEKESYTPVDLYSTPRAAGSPWYHEQGEANVGQPLTQQQLDNLKTSNVIVAVVGEYPFAEEYGDRENLDVLNFDYAHYRFESLDVDPWYRDGWARRKHVKHKDLMKQLYDTFGPDAPVEDQRPIVCILISHRPIYIGSNLDDSTHVLGQSDSVVAAWYPGTECSGVTDVLFGDSNFTGELRFSWPNNIGQWDPAGPNLPNNKLPEDILFPYGYGLKY